MRRSVLLLVAVATVVLLASGVALAVTPTSTPYSGTQEKGPDAALDGALRSLVARHGGRSSQGHRRSTARPAQEGPCLRVRNLKSGLPMRANDQMRIASTAKAFSGAVALSLVRERKLSLNDTISKRLRYLPQARSKVTLRQLLNHTSGIPDFSLDGGFQEALFASLKKAPPPEELLTYVYDEDLLFEPGSRYHYSNSDNIAVALMVEAATKRSYEDQLRERVYEPLDLKKTALPKGPNLIEPYIHGYDNDPKEQTPEDYSEIVVAGWSWVSGGILSTPADLNDFIRGYVGGELFDAHTQAKQRQVLEGGSSEPPGPGYNSADMAVFRYQTKCGTVWGHTGNTPGYTQFMAARPDRSRSVVVSVNEELTPKDGAPGAFDALRRAEGRAVCAALADR